MAVKRAPVSLSEPNERGVRFPVSVIAYEA